MREHISSNHALRTLYFLTFVLTLNITLPAFVNSSFLERFLGAGSVGLLFSIAMGLSIWLLVMMPYALRRFGLFKTALVCATTQLLATLGLMFFHSWLVVIPFFIIAQNGGRLTGYALDLLIDDDSKKKETGGVRGLFLTIVNLGWILAPLIAGFFAASGDFGAVYFLGALLMLPFFPLFVIHFRNYTDRPYRVIPIRDAARQMIARSDVGKIFCVRTLLFFFFAWMTIYTPIYLVQQLQFPWEQVGIIFTAMLLPYVLLEYPLGRLADSRLGEKEFLIAGLLITGLSTLGLFVANSSSFFVWAILLFLTRVGASMIESMSEVFFFKKVGSNDMDIVSIFRMAEPAAYVVAPIIAFPLVAFAPMRYLFLVLAFLVLGGIWFAYSIKDTR